MSFVVVKNPRVWWSVIVPVLSEDGVREEQEFKMRFRDQSPQQTPFRRRSSGSVGIASPTKCSSPFSMGTPLRRFCGQSATG